MRKILLAILILLAPVCFAARTGNTTTDYIHLGSVDEFGSTTKYTYVFHYKGVANAGSGNLRRTLAITAGAAANMAAGFSWDSSAGAFQKAAYQLTTGGYVTAQISQAMNSGTWYWIGAIWDGTNLKVYVDGSEQGTVGASDFDRTDLIPKITILALEVAGTFSQFDDGTIEKLSIWPKVALTTGELFSVMAGQDPRTIGPIPKIYLPLRGDDSPERDEAGNLLKYNGTLNGTTKAAHEQFTQGFRKPIL